MARVSSDYLPDVCIDVDPCYTVCRKPAAATVAKENLAAKHVNVMASSSTDAFRATKPAPDPAISSKIDELTDQVPPTSAVPISVFGC